MPEVTYYPKGLGLRSEVRDQLVETYHSEIVARMREDDFTLVRGRLTVRLAREFGFCYGVDRAVDYAYQTRVRFPDRRVFLTGEIIHNPYVNARLREMGIGFLSDRPESERYSTLATTDVVILPAFGVSVSELERLQERGCVLVDTTCGSVLNVWKNVHRYAQDGYTAVIHGKYRHEETRATASQALKYPSGRYLIIRDRAEADVVCAFIRGGGDRRALVDGFAHAMSPGFDPDRDLQRVGLANQTTMLMSESVAIGEMFRAAMIDRYGAEALVEHYRSFDTICSATQDRQDAVVELINDGSLHLAIVIGGYNSSNTNNLARICAGRLPTYHIDGAECLASLDEIRHKPVGATAEESSRAWLPPGSVRVGLTAGASTPNNVVGAVVERLVALAAHPA